MKVNATALRFHNTYLPRARASIKNARRKQHVIYNRPSQTDKPLRMTAVIDRCNVDGTYSIEVKQVLDSAGHPFGPRLNMRLRVTGEEIEAAA